MALPTTSIPDHDAQPKRLFALILALLCSGPLVFAATLTPDAGGIGTHTQMGLPECGFVQATGLPCATCGCTTAFAHAADGSLLSALVTQPFGALLALTLAMLALIAAWSAVSGMSLIPLGQAVMNRRFALAWLVLLLGSWAYKASAVALGG